MAYVTKVYEAFGSGKVLEKGSETRTKDKSKSFEIIDGFVSIRTRLTDKCWKEFEEMYALRLSELTGGFISILNWSIAL